MTDTQAPTGYVLELVPETDEELVSLLQLDKHTTIEGNVAEIFTESRLVSPVLGTTLSQFSWWFHSEEGEQYKASAVSELDAGAWPHLPEHEHLIGRAVREAVAGLRIVTFRNGEFGGHEVSQGFIRKAVRLLRPHPMTTLSPDSERDPERHEKAAEWLAQHGLLRAVGLQRLFANFFAPDCYMWDLDCIGVYRNQVIAFDYKHKYPDSQDKLGANGGISRLYRHLHSCGIPVIYIALKKNRKDRSRSAVDMLAAAPPEWYVCNARIFSESGSTLENRSGTAYDGGTPQRSKGVHVDQFTLVRTASELREFLDSCIERKFL
jgi:hypothetical protein